MSSEPVRLFIAIELPAAARDALAALQKRLQSADTSRAIRWSSIDGIHLTLKFLGNVASDKIPSITAGLTAATAGRVPFDLAVAGAGCFPNMGKPRVLWAGSGGNSPALNALRDAVEQHVAPLGYPTDERPFSPHFTLGRARQEASASALAALGTHIAKLDVGTLYSWRVDSLSLMRSDLKPSGAVYTQIAHFGL
jgi:2'-5' RNA ligase